MRVSHHEKHTTCQQDTEGARDTSRAGVWPVPEGGNRAQPSSGSAPGNSWGQELFSTDTNALLQSPQSPAPRAAAGLLKWQCTEQQPKTSLLLLFFGLEYLNRNLIVSVRTPSLSSILNKHSPLSRNIS